MERQAIQYFAITAITTMFASILFSVGAFAQSAGGAGGAGTGPTGGVAGGIPGDPGNSIVNDGSADNNMGNSSISDSDFDFSGITQEPGTAGNSMGSTNDPTEFGTTSGNSLSSTGSNGG
jgi:hypothetical protein